MKQEGQQTVAPEVLEALGNIDSRQPMSPELFNAIARLVPQIAIEAVLMRWLGNCVEVYMIRRSSQDTAYANELHSPGSILRAGEDIRAVLDRLSKKEFHVPITEFEEVGELFFQEQRGWFNNRILLIQVDGEPTGGKWYSVDDLPADVVDHHLSQVIPIAANAYKARLQ